MKKNIYIKPEVEVVMMHSERLLRENSYAIDGETPTPIIDDDPDEIFSKDNKIWDDIFSQDKKDVWNR